MIFCWYKGEGLRRGLRWSRRGLAKALGAICCVSVTGSLGFWFSIFWAFIVLACCVFDYITGFIYFIVFTMVARKIPERVGDWAGLWDGVNDFAVDLHNLVLADNVEIFHILKELFGLVVFASRFAHTELE